MINFEHPQQEQASCPPTKVNEWVEQQLAAIKAEAVRLENSSDNLED